MKFSWSGKLRIAAVYIGGVVGAGFASGQEILQFFLVFGTKGLWGILFAAGMFMFFGVIILFLAGQMQEQSYRQILDILLGKNIGLLMDIWIMFFLFFGLCIMLAGSGAVFAQHFGAARYAGTALTAACIMAALAGEGEGVLFLNSFLVPILFILILIVGGACLLKSNPLSIQNNVILQSSHSLVAKNWIGASFLYVSYNIIIALVIFASLDRGQIQGNILGGVIGGLGLGFLALAMGLPMLKYPGDVSLFEIPMLHLAGEVHGVFEYFYTLALWLAMLTTAVANSYGLVKRVYPYFYKFVPVGTRGFGIILILIVLPFSKFGFVPLVANIYPIFGYAGIPILLTLSVKAFRIVRSGSIR
ncbi:MAG: hypothetical protein GX318_03525 [Clostridia bacterium]|nr:hypothetical protein [Clostridia bacterium]